MGAGASPRRASTTLRICRLSIARLLVVRRPVWLLDEPTSALDVAGQALFVRLMRDHLNGGGIIIAATHAPLGIDGPELRMRGAG